MSDSDKTQSSQSEAQSSDEDTTTPNRSIDDYAKRLKETSAEAKKYRQTNAELKAQLEAFEKEKLESQGKFQEIAAKEKLRADNAEKKHKDASTNYAFKVVRSQVKAEAAKLGCVDSDALITLMDMSKLSVDDDFEVEGSSMKEELEKMTKERPYLFPKATPSHRDAPLKGSKEDFKGKDAKSMTMKEKMDAFAESMKNRK